MAVLACGLTEVMERRIGFLRGLFVSESGNPSYRCHDYYSFDCQKNLKVGTPSM